MRRLFAPLWVLPVCLLLNVAFLHAQSRYGTVKGLVRNEEGRPVPGVSVTATDTKANFKIGTQTDSAGVFEFSRIPAGGAYQFHFSCVGYNDKTLQGYSIQPDATTSVAAKLDAAVTGLDDIVVIGYQSVRRRDITSSVSSVTAKDLKDFPVATAAEALAGKLAGVSVKTSEGAPGADIQILVRGGTSLTQDNAPLYIVDGVPVANALSIISPNEIESIDVLKDLASTAIYGARGANGVVLITTKGGKKGRTVVSLDAYSGVRKISNEIKVLRPYDFVNYQYELINLHYNGFKVTDTTVLNGFKNNYGSYNDLEIYKSFPMVNWQDMIFGRNARSNTQILTMSGGANNATYNFTLNNTSEQGVMLASGLKRTFASFRFDNKISNKFSVALNVRYSRQRVDGAGTSATGGSSNNRLKYAVRFQPYQGIVNFEEFDPNAIFDNTINLSNPLTSALTDVREAYSNNLITSGQLSWNVMPGLTVKSLIGYTLGESVTNSFSGVANYSVSSRNSSSQYSSMPYISLSRNNNTNISNTNTVNYKPDLGKNIQLDVLLGQELNQTNTTAFNQTIKYFPAGVTAAQAFSNVQQANPPSGAIQPSPTSDANGERLFSYFARAMFSYKRKYTLNLSVRRDGSSKFGPANRWGNFPSAQFAWRLSDEDFYRNLNSTWAPNLKVRLSYGTAGNNRVSNDRLFATTFSTSTSAAGYATTDNSQTSGLYAANLANPNLKWETTLSRNVGIDFDFLNGRISGSIDAYINRTSDLLLQANVPQQTGYLRQFQNIGVTQNKGLELQLAASVINKKYFTYSTSFNISTNKNTIAELQGGVKSYTVSSGWGSQTDDFLVEVGKPVGQYYGYIADGFYSVDDFDATLSDPVKNTWVLKKGVVNDAVIQGLSNVSPGVMKLRTTTSTDTVLRTTDRTVLGTVQPKFFGGWNNQFSYGNFDASVFVNFSYGNRTMNANTVEFSSVYQANGNNVLEKFKDRFRRFDDNGSLITDWKRLQEYNKDAKIYYPTRGQYQVTSDAIEDGSFLRISNVTIGYSLPASLLKPLKSITKVRVYATVNNLYTFTKYTGYDPEANTRRSSPLTRGVDYSAYPRSRYFLGGISVVF